MENQPTLSRRRIIALTSITVLAIVIRFIPMPSAIRWQDTGIELLTAYHVARFNEFPFVGVYAASINFFHPPWYLWGLGLLMKVFPDYLTLIDMSAVFHALSVIPLYFTVAWLTTPVAGLIAALLFATGGFSIPLSWTLQSQNIIVPIILWCFALWLFAKRHQSLPLLVSSTVLTSMAISVNYAALLVAPLTFFITLWDLKNDTKRVVLWVTVWIFMLTVVFVPLFVSTGLFEIVQKLFSIPLIMVKPQSTDGHHWFILIPLFYAAVGIGLGFLWNHAGRFTAVILTLLIGAYCIYGIQTAYGKKQSGDILSSVACTQSLSEAIQLTTILERSPTPFTVEVGNPIRPNVWNNFIFLSEQKLTKQLVTLDTTHGFFTWPPSPGKTFLLCMDTTVRSNDIFLSSTCPTKTAQRLNTTPHLLFDMRPRYACTGYLLQ